METNKKTVFKTLREKNATINRIVDVIDKRNNFLIIGHKNPDEDCISSMIAFGVLLSKLSKETKIFLESKVHEHFQYLLNICKYNSIEIVKCSDIENTKFSSIIICDTPKPSMMETCPQIDSFFKNPEIVKIEIDHHVGADSEYIGDRDYCLVTEASSACELIGQLVLKMNKMPKILTKYNVTDLLTRNLVLAILTGIIGDTKMGKFIKSKSERRFYNYFSKIFNTLLKEKTVSESNFSSKEEVFNELARLSAEEDKCYNMITNEKFSSKNIKYILLSQEKMDKLFKEFENETIVTVMRTVADDLAEESGKISLVAYYDNPKNSNMIQFRIRRSQDYKIYDVRNILTIFSIKNGGGHEGAIGFRIPKDEIKDIDLYVKDLVTGIEKEISKV
jgi:nanoRNase/pAp phosphatase (c-di-AMP/oligoRNAs hydrolase)